MLDRKLRIAWLHENLLYWNGGVKWILEVSGRLIHLCQLDIFVTRAAESNKLRFKDAGVDVVEFASVASDSLKYWLFYPYYILANARKLKKVIASYDVVISSSPTTCLIASLLDIPAIFILFEPNALLYSDDFVAGLPAIKRAMLHLARPLFRYFDQKAVRKVDRLVAPDKFTASRCESIYGRKADIVYIGVDHAVFKPRSAESLRRKYEGRQVIIHSSTYLNPVKGTAYLVRAMQEIAKRVPSCLLLILNPHQDEKARADLLDLASRTGVFSNMEFLPEISEYDLPDYFSLARVIVQPSLYESTRMALAEAAACGTPGVSFSGGTAGEDIVDGETGFVVPVGDVGSLARSVITLLTDTDLHNRLGQNAIRLATTRFSWDTNAQTMLELANAVIRNKGKRND